MKIQATTFKFPMTRNSLNPNLWFFQLMESITLRISASFIIRGLKLIWVSRFNCSRIVLLTSEKLFIIKLTSFCIQPFLQNSSQTSFLLQGSLKTQSFWFRRKTCLNLERDHAGWVQKNITIIFKMKSQFLPTIIKESKHWVDHPKETFSWNLKRFRQNIAKLDILQILAGP